MIEKIKKFRPPSRAWLRRKRGNPIEREVDEPRPRKKIINGRAILYWEYNPTALQTIFFWHGFRGSHRGLLAVAERLSTYRIIIPDLPGWGESDPLVGEHTITNTIRCLKKFHDSFHLKSFILAGHSFGATLAFMYAARHPSKIDHLLLIQPVVTASSFTSRLGEVYYETVARLPTTVRHRVIASPILNRGKSELLSVESNFRRRQRLMANEQKNLAHVRDWVEIEMYRSLARTRFFPALQSLQMLTTLFIGTRDRMTPIATNRKIAAAIPNHRVITLAGAGHFVPMENPELLAQAIQQQLGVAIQ